MVTASAVFGATGSTSAPGTGRPCLVKATGDAAAEPDRTAKPPAVAAIAAPALNTPRRDTTPLATSPKYSLPEGLGASWAQALPQRYSQVTADLPPACVNRGSK